MYDVISDIRRCPQEFVWTYAVYLKCPIFSKSKMSAKVRSEKKQSQNFTQAFADVRMLTDMIALADMEKCPQKSAGFDKGTDICGFLGDICEHMPTSSKSYTNVRGSPHMSAAYARPVADIEGTGDVYKMTCNQCFHVDLSLSVGVPRHNIVIAINNYNAIPCISGSSSSKLHGCCCCLSLSLSLWYVFSLFLSEAPQDCVTIYYTYLQFI